MKTPLLLLAAFLAADLLVSCSTTPCWTPQQRAAIVAALDRAPHSKTLPANQPLITPETQFVARCPYDGTVCLSKSCVCSGGSTAADGSNVQEWTINFVCPRDGMSFCDHRTQTIAAIKSIRLPIIPETKVSTPVPGRLRPPVPPAQPKFRQRSSAQLP